MIRLLSIISVSLLAAGCSQNLTSSHSMTVSNEAFAPPAFKPFCAREPKLCSSAGGVKFMQLTPQREAELDRINRSVNARIRQVADSGSASYGGQADTWRVARDSGDCEDIAILKKKELMAKGWPASTLLLTTATFGGVGHTVLTVRTHKGDMILDNRTNAVKEWRRTSYKYFARQSQEKNGKWKRIGA